VKKGGREDCKGQLQINAAKVQNELVLGMTFLLPCRNTFRATMEPFCCGRRTAESTFWVGWRVVPLMGVHRGWSNTICQRWCRSEFMGWRWDMKTFAIRSSFSRIRWRGL